MLLSPKNSKKLVTVKNKRDYKNLMIGKVQKVPTGNAAATLTINFDHEFLLIKTFYIKTVLVLDILRKRL